MSRTILRGPAGSGKTSRILDEIAPLLRPDADGRFRRFLVVVPTYSQAEHLKRRLLRRTRGAATQLGRIRLPEGESGCLDEAGSPGSLRAARESTGIAAPNPGGDPAGALGTALLDRGVVTFEQLAERRTGWRLQSLAPVAVRDALVRSAFDEFARSGGGADSAVFADVARFPGFRRAALRFLDEVKNLELETGRDIVEAAEDRLRAIADVLPGRRGDAVRGLARVLDIYESRRRAEGLRDHGDLVRELLRALRDAAGDGGGEAGVERGSGSAGGNGNGGARPAAAGDRAGEASSAILGRPSPPGAPRSDRQAPARHSGRAADAGPDVPGAAAPPTRSVPVGPARESLPSRFDLFAIDGFTDLTPVQAAIVSHLARASDRAIATVLGDPESPPGSPFDASTGLVERLLADGFVVETAGRRPDPAARAARAVPAVPAAAAPPPPAEPSTSWRLRGDLARLERCIAGFAVEPAASDGSVRLLAGADPDDEADRVARNVLRWTTEGFARAEILIVVRNSASSTAARIVEALGRHGVPAQRFGGEPLTTVPCVRSALRIVRLLAAVAGDAPGDAARPAAGGRRAPDPIPADDLLAALRQGDLKGVEDADADRVAELVRERGAATEEAVLALARDPERGAPSVLDWAERLHGLRAGPLERPPAAHAEAAFAALPQLLRLRPLEPFADGDEESVARDAAALRALRDLAGDLVRALRAAGRSAVAPAAFADELAEAASTARFTRRDPRDDAVHVVGAEEARQWEARAVVVAGLRLGEFPAAAREDLFLSDDERALVAKSTRLRLPNRLDEALRRERLLFYSAATRATERVVLTCPVADDGGNPVLRSPFLDLAATIFPPELRRPDGAGRSPGDVRPAPGETFHEDDLTRIALAALTERFAKGDATQRGRSPQPEGESGCADEAGSPENPRVARGFHGIATQVRPHTGLALLPRVMQAGAASDVARAARGFLGREPSLRGAGPGRRILARPRARSSSSLADFAQCPFRHFARKGLALEEPPAGPDDGLGAMLAGTIAHAVLETAGKDLAGDPAAGSPEHVAAVFDRLWPVFAAPFRRDLALEKSRAGLRSALVAFAAEGGLGGAADGFAPVQFEWKFGLPGTPRVVLGEGDDAVAISGAADRIDVETAPPAGCEPRAIVLDYKWSERSRFSGIGRKIDEGTDLQLPMYAIAARRLLGTRVVAVGYVTLRDDERTWLPITADSPVRAGRNPPEGWGIGDGSDGLARAEDHVRRLDRAIRGGACETAPRDENLCGSRCAFADLCRFEGVPGRTPRGGGPGAAGTSGVTGVTGTTGATASPAGRTSGAAGTAPPDGLAPAVARPHEERPR